MKTAIANDREIFNHLARHEALKRLRVLFDTDLGRPIWWLTFKINGGPKQIRQHLESSHEIWKDPRLRKFRQAPRVYDELKKRSKEKQPSFFEQPKGTWTYAVPLSAEGRVIGMLALTGVRRGIRHETLERFSAYLKILVENCAKTEELDRLSATIRPRAIALSTVHTVHRIINSTLNLDELVSRLAHLTAQVLRVHRCVIYLFDPGARRASFSNNTPAKKPLWLVLKAKVGYSKRNEPPARVRIGKSVEGRVAKTAETVLRRKLISIPLIDEDVIGVMTLSHKKDKKDFNYFDREILTTLAEEAVIAIKNAQLYEEQRRVTLGTIQSLAVILGTRSPDPMMPPEVFLRLALRVAEDLKLGEEELQALHYAALLKETAKVGIPEEILKKPTKLTGEEYSRLREHPIKGAKIVQSFESLRPVAPIILSSREKYDGTGYPEGLKGEKIPFGARILAVINAFEAIVIGRPYRDKSSLDEALEEISQNSGTQFDPKVVEAFIRVVQKEGLRGVPKHAG